MLSIIVFICNLFHVPQMSIQIKISSHSHIWGIMPPHPLTFVNLSHTTLLYMENYATPILSNVWIYFNPPYYSWGVIVIHPLIHRNLFSTSLSDIWIYYTPPSHIWRMVPYIHPPSYIWWFFPFNSLIARNIPTLLYIGFQHTLLHLGIIPPHHLISGGYSLTLSCILGVTSFTVSHLEIYSNPCWRLEIHLTHISSGNLLFPLSYFREFFDSFTSRKLF